MRRLLSCALAAMVVGGCYKYEPISAPVPGVGESVRAHLTPSGSQDVTPVLGREVAWLDGRLVGNESGRFRFSVTQTRSRLSGSAAWGGEEITIPGSAVDRVERRVLDRGKTIRASILAVVGAVGITAIVQSAARNPSGTPPGGGDPNPGLTILFR